MAFVVWIVLGLAAGFIGSQLGHKRAQSTLPDIVLGVTGAIAGGWLLCDWISKIQLRQRGLPPSGYAAASRKCKVRAPDAIFWHTDSIRFGELLWL